MKPRATRYRFGDFDLNPAERTLLCAGKPIRLTPLDFELLVALVERSGSLVRKEELLLRLWPGTIVEEGNLAKHVSTLRKALGTAPDVGSMIETVPKIGFRFVAVVDELDGADALAPVTRASAFKISRGVAAALAVIALSIAAAILFQTTAAVPEAPRSWGALAVLPFRSLDRPEGEADTLGLRLADRIITRLGGQQVLAIRPTSAIRQYATGARPPAADIGRTLGVGVLLDGHIQRAGDVVRVTVQLTDVATGATVWAEPFDQTSAELFKLEDAIAERVAAALRLQLAAVEQARLRKRYTENAPAYLSYLDGRDALLRYTPEGTRQAIASFERALAMDSGYVLARAGLAASSAEMYLRFAPESEVRYWGERAEREAAAALAIDSDVAEAHVAQAAVLRKREFDWDNTIAASRRALTLNPNLDQPHFYSAAAFYHLGLMDQSLAELERGRRIGGGDAVEPLRIEALVALFSGNYPVARARLEEVSRRSNRAIGDVYLALAHYYLGNTSAAIAMLESLTADTPASTSARAGAALASIHARLGDPAAARRALDAVLARGYRDHHVSYSLGAAFAQLGEPARAMDSLRTAAATGFPCAIWYTTDPLLQPLRSDPAFTAFTADLVAQQNAAAARHAVRGH